MASDPPQGPVQKIFNNSLVPVSEYVYIHIQVIRKPQQPSMHWAGAKPGG